MQLIPNELQKLAHYFEQFATFEAAQVSPLYNTLCLAVAQDRAMLELAAQAASSPIPNLFMGAVQYLLRREPDHPLRAYYPTLAGSRAPDADAVALFRSYCLEHSPEIKQILATRRVQTNEVRRCALLVPAFGVVAQQAAGRPLALVEVGTSAGLNLLWDHYAYDYGDGQVYGDPTSELRLGCELRGQGRPPLPEGMPVIALRLGLDLQPIDVGEDAAVDWLRALIWPEHTARLERLNHAVEIVRANPPTLRAGDAVDVLPDVLAAMPDDTMLCLYHTFTLNQFSTEARERFQTMLDHYGANKDLCCISILGAHKDYPELRLQTYQNGSITEHLLARCDAHGQWLEWLAPS